MMERVKLNNGSTIPKLGFGVWEIRDETQCKSAVSAALESGYRLIDTAQIYGNETAVGLALQTSEIDRSDIFVTTKIWNDNMWWDDLIPSFEESLRKLQTDYVDLLLLHFPVTELRSPAWRRMEDIYESGRAKAIGVSNYTIKHLKELLAMNTVRPAVNQVELHVYLQQPELVDFCHEHDIVVEAYSPLAHGYKMSNDVLEGIARKHNKTQAQIMIRWCVEVGAVPLPKSAHADRIHENAHVFDFQLDQSDMKAIERLDRNLRTCWDPTNIP